MQSQIKESRMFRYSSRLIFSESRRVYLAQCGSNRTAAFKLRTSVITERWLADHIIEPRPWLRSCWISIFHGDIRYDSGNKRNIYHYPPLYAWSSSNEPHYMYLVRWDWTSIPGISIYAAKKNIAYTTRWISKPVAKYSLATLAIWGIRNAWIGNGSIKQVIVQ